MLKDKIQESKFKGDAVIWEEVKNVTFNGKKIKPVGEKTEIISK